MQYRLTAPSILAAWEHGAGRLPLDRAMAILWAASTRDDVDPADLPLAERDRRLLAIRAATFGPTIPARATCPECNAELEMELDAQDLGEALAQSGTQALTNDGETGQMLRPLTSRDVAAVVDVPAERLAAALRARLTGREIDGDDAEAVDRRIEAQAAAAELSTRLTCSECGAAWSETLDVVAHVWSDIETTALRLLGEVAELAAAFGWSEDAILSLSPARRMTYLAWARQA